MKEKLIINSLDSLTFDAQNDGHYITICEKEGKCGITDNLGEVILPFEYDNISRTGFCFLQSIKNGKVGLVHLGESDGKIVINQIIPCEHDYGEVKQFQNVVLLHKNDTYKNLVSVYFGNSQKLIQDAQDCSVLRTFTNLINVDKDELSYLFDCTTGELIYKTTMTCVDGYNTPQNRVVQYITDDGNCCLVVINDGVVKELVLKTDRVIAIDNVEIDDFPLTVGFLIERPEGYILLDEECGGVTPKVIEVNVKSVIEFVKDGENFELEIDNCCIM